MPAIHVTNVHQSIFSGDACGGHMQEMSPLGGNLPVYLDGVL